MLPTLRTCLGVSSPPLPPKTVSHEFLWTCLLSYGSVVVFRHNPVAAFLFQDVIVLSYVSVVVIRHNPVAEFLFQGVINIAVILTDATTVCVTSSGRPCLSLPWRTSSSALSTPAGCVPWLEYLRSMCRSTPRCCQSSSYSACSFFACLRLFPVVSLWLGRPILSRVQTISIYSCQEILVRSYRFMMVFRTCSLVTRSF